MNLTNESIKVQESLKTMHSIEVYNGVVSKFKARAGDDFEVLSYMAEDKMLSQQTRLFAVAAMGE